MSRDDLLRKIRGLLAIGARSNYAAEAETAMVMAQRLMLEHGLSESEVEVSGQKYGDETIGDQFVRRPAEDLFVAPLLDAFFFVRCGWGHRWDDEIGAVRIIRRIFGEPHHRAVAEFVWVYLVRTFRALWNARVASMSVRFAGRRTLFYRGLQSGLSRRLRDERGRHCDKHAGQVGLIRMTNEALDRALAIEHPLSKIVGPRKATVADIADLQSLHDGQIRGSKIAIPNAIADKSDTPKLLGVVR